MNIAIVDDVQIDSDVLALYLNKFFQENHIYTQLKKFNNTDEFMEQYSPGIFDIVFLDIFMNGPDGITIAERMREAGDTCFIIFSTSSKDYAIHGFRVHAYDYLVKPYSYEQLSKTMEYCKQDLLKRGRYIEVKEGRTIIHILLQDIIYTDYYNHYIQIHTKSRVVRYYKAFSEFSQMLLPYPQFLCCYRNCIINMDEVDTLTHTDFIMKNKEIIPISRSNRQEIRQKYVDYEFSKMADCPLKL